MQIIEGQEFSSFYDDRSGRVFEDLEFRHCTFISSAVSITQDPRLRATIRNVKLVKCEARACSLSAIVEDVLVDGLNSNHSNVSYASVFKHVTLRGPLGTLRVLALMDYNPEPAVQQEFDQANAAYYATVDWALDISEAEFTELNLRGVPARLVRRDPATQVVVTREKALAGKWRTLDLSGTYWPRSLEDMLERNAADVVLAAPKRGRRYGQFLKGLRILRDAGVAEPD